MSQYCYEHQFDSTGDTLSIDVENRTKDKDFAVWVSVHQQPGGACYVDGDTSGLSKGVVVPAGQTFKSFKIPSISKTYVPETGASAPFDAAEASLEAWPIGEVRDNGIFLVSVSYLVLSRGHTGTLGTTFETIGSSTAPILNNADYSTMGHHTLMVNLANGKSKTITGAGLAYDHNSHGFVSEITGDAHPSESTHSLSLRLATLFPSPPPHGANTGITKGHQECLNAVAYVLIPVCVLLFLGLLGMVYWHRRHMGIRHADGIGYGVGGKGALPALEPSGLDGAPVL